MSVKNAIRDFFFPPVCPGCREVFHIKYGENNALCQACERKWELLKSGICPSCGERFSDCRCAPKALEKAGAVALIKLVPYTPKSSVSNNVVLYMKRKRDSRVFTFAANELLYELERYIKKMGICREDIIITYCPRKRKTVNELGFDQAKILASELSKKSGIKCETLIVRKFSLARAQKKLDAKKREKSVKNAFALKKGVDLKSKTVILLDDLVTTGSTMGKCASLIKKGGAALIIGLCVAYTEKQG